MTDDPIGTISDEVDKSLKRIFADKLIGVAQNETSKLALSNELLELSINVFGIAKQTALKALAENIERLAPTPTPKKNGGT